MCPIPSQQASPSPAATSIRRSSTHDLRDRPRIRKSATFDPPDLRLSQDSLHSDHHDVLAGLFAHHAADRLDPDATGRDSSVLRENNNDSLPRHLCRSRPAASSRRSSYSSRDAWSAVPRGESSAAAGNFASPVQHQQQQPWHDLAANRDLLDSTFARYASILDDKHNWGFSTLRRRNSRSAATPQHQP